MKSRDEIVRLVKAAIEANLEGLEYLSYFSLEDLEDLAKAYNGIGPEFMPSDIRDRFTRYLSLFEPAALIHDVETDKSDGSRDRFLAANDRFRRNCLKLANRAYPWWSWKRYRARAAAEILFDFVSADSFGWKAWQDAAKKNI